MNCKQGDLAIVISGKSAGKICHVDYASEVLLAHWHCTFPYPVLTLFCVSTAAVVPDSWLRPVSGLPTEEAIDTEAIA